MIIKAHALPVIRQCKIFNLSRSSLYYQPVSISNDDLNIMSLIDEIHLRYPFYGSRRIRDELLDNGFKPSRGRVSNFMKKMGVEALYRKPRLSKPHPGHKIYPYLLRSKTIDKANQVWATDITYIPLAQGFVYLVAIMDWASGKVLSRHLSNTLDTSFCVDALEEAIREYGRPEIFNSDQGSQFTSTGKRGCLPTNMSLIRLDNSGQYSLGNEKFLPRLSSVNYLTFLPIL